MKNQYVGDIGDYGKYALLRALACRYSIGVNWYFTPDDGRPDGKFVEYLKNDTDPLDKELYQKLKSLLILPDVNLCLENRNVKAIENSGILPDTTLFFNEVLDFTKIADRKACRECWMKRSFEALGKPDVIFLDPDNGLEW